MTDEAYYLNLARREYRRILDNVVAMGSTPAELLEEVNHYFESTGKPRSPGQYVLFAREIMIDISETKREARKACFARDDDGPDDSGPDERIAYARHLANYDFDRAADGR